MQMGLPYPRRHVPWKRDSCDQKSKDEADVPHSAKDRADHEKLRLVVTSWGTLLTMLNYSGRKG